MQVFDGDSPQAPSIAKWCGYKPPDPIKSSTEKLFIHFQTDTSGEKTVTGSKPEVDRKSTGGYINAI